MIKQIQKPTGRYKIYASLNKKPTEPIRLCNVCHIPKPISEFGKNATNAGGHRPTCKTCINKKERETYNEKKTQFPF